MFFLGKITILRGFLRISCRICLESKIERSILGVNFPPFFVMKSKKNLTRFTYESAAFEGWRLCISRGGTTFTKYFPDKKYGGGRRSLAAAEKVLDEIKVILESGKRVNGKLSPATIRKAGALLSKL